MNNHDTVSVLSWNIATKPELYWKLSPNPYSSQALTIISKEFPGADINEVVRAVALAEPEGKYDREFTQLSKDKQEEKLLKEENATAEINKNLVQCFKKHLKYMELLPRDIVYECLSKFIFGTSDIKEIESKFSQKQRKDFKLKIIDFIEDKPVKNESIPKLAMTTLFFILIIFVMQVSNQKITYQNLGIDNEVLGADTQNENVELPKRLEIPSIGVNANIENVGVTSTGIMGVPINSKDVGWFNIGPRPGQKGSAVIAGHLDGENGENAVFTNLNKLKKGDKLYVIDEGGNIIPFVVEESREYGVGYADEVFSRNDGVYLNLITCDGVWDGTKKSYSKRLVVFTHIDN